MDKVDQQLATIIQDIKSPTLDALRTYTVTDGISEILYSSIALVLLVAVIVVLLRLSRETQRVLWFKGPFDDSDINAMRGIGCFAVFVLFMFVCMGLLNPNAWLKIFYPDTQIAQRILTRR